MMMNVKRISVFTGFSLCLLLTDAFTGLAPRVIRSMPTAMATALDRADTRIGDLSRLMDELTDGILFTPTAVSPSLWKRFSPSDMTTPADALAPIRVDVSENEKNYHITADMPGISKEDIKLSFNEGNLVLSGERKEEVEKKEGGEGEGKTSYYYKEVNYGKVYRSFKLPPNADTSKADAQLSDGVLKITLPKRQLPMEHTIEIK